jgi:hypothetical protein
LAATEQTGTLPMRVLLTTLALCTALATPAGAKDAPLAQAALALRLYESGLAVGDALTVATAARLRRDAGLPEGTAPDWPAMLDRAETLAAGDAATLEIIADIRDEGSRGVASGPIHHLDALAPGQAEKRPPMPFRGGEYAEVYVESATGADLNLTVLDAAGRVVCTDTDRSHVAYCGWTPASDGDFTLVITNAGTEPADYALLTN